MCTTAKGCDSNQPSLERRRHIGVELYQCDAVKVVETAHLTERAWIKRAWFNTSPTQWDSLFQISAEVVTSDRRPPTSTEGYKAVSRPAASQCTTFPPPVTRHENRTTRPEEHWKPDLPICILRSITVTRLAKCLFLRKTQQTSVAFDVVRGY